MIRVVKQIFFIAGTVSLSACFNASEVSITSLNPDEAPAAKAATVSYSSLKIVQGTHLAGGSAQTFSSGSFQMQGAGVGGVLEEKTSASASFKLVGSAYVQ